MINEWKNKIIQGDCIELMKKLPDNSVDAIVTDPPYGLEFMGKGWDRGVPSIPFWKEMIRVLKHGGFLLSFGGTRTYHRMACAIEDAGFEIRDTIMWLYGSGFPKSANISLLFDKRECMKQLKEKLGRKPTRDEFKESWENFRRVVGKKKCGYQVSISKSRKEQGYRPNLTNATEEVNITQPVTPEAKQWVGWGTALKPACEPIVVARKPLSEKNVALNVLKWGTGGINIDACRIKHNEPLKKTNRKSRKDGNVFDDSSCGFKSENIKLASASLQGRFPANIILDEEAGKMLDEQSGERKTTWISPQHQNKRSGEFLGALKHPQQQGFNDNGGASRFFYCPKASKSERNLGCEELEDKPFGKDSLTAGIDRRNSSHENKSKLTKYVPKNNHPTVKPVKLMQYLVRLVTPKNGIVLDPFGGSGTTAIACKKEGFNYLLMDDEEEYIKIANARIKPFLEQKRLNLNKD